jgi:hypothetical protein
VGKSEVHPAESTQIMRMRAISAGRVSIITDLYTKLLNIWKKRHLQQYEAVLAGTAKVNISSGDRNYPVNAGRPLIQRFMIQSRLSSDPGWRSSRDKKAGQSPG